MRDLRGVENSVKTLENFLGIDINYYARVNFTSLIQMVDALGGIEVYSDQDIPKLGIHEGINDMDGKKLYRSLERDTHIRMETIIESKINKKY